MWLFFVGIVGLVSVLSRIPSFIDALTVVYDRKYASLFFPNPGVKLTLNQETERWQEFTNGVKASAQHLPSSVNLHAAFEIWQLASFVAVVVLNLRR